MRAPRVGAGGKEEIGWAALDNLNFDAVKSLEIPIFANAQPGFSGGWRVWNAKHPALKSDQPNIEC